MSTNHRPQLESKRGKVIRIKDSIKHARALPQQTSLKYRQDVRPPVGDYKSDSEGDDPEVTTPPLKKIKIESKEVLMDRLEVANEKREITDVQENESDSGSDSGTDSESDDETALLLQEIEKIRQEKVSQDQDEGETRSVETPPNTSAKRKSWRLTTAFDNKSKALTDKTEEKYSTDCLDSEYHQKLMSKYIR